MEFSRTLMPLILASASPRRRRILERLGLRFEVRPVDLDEAAALAGDRPAPADAAERLAVLKARAAARSGGPGTYIGSDTVVAVGDRMLGKPSSPEEARRILGFLSGKVQEVISGLCLIHRPSGIELRGREVTRIHTRPMSRSEIEEYVATGECFGKAGAYAIQETGDRFVARLEGSFDNVVGFPTELFLDRLSELDARVRDWAAA